MFGDDVQIRAVSRFNLVALVLGMNESLTEFVAATVTSELFTIRRVFVRVLNDIRTRNVGWR